MVVLCPEGPVGPLGSPWVGCQRSVYRIVNVLFSLGVARGPLGTGHNNSLGQFSCCISIFSFSPSGIVEPCHWTMYRGSCLAMWSTAMMVSALAQHALP